MWRTAKSQVAAAARCVLATTGMAILVVGGALVLAAMLIEADDPGGEKWQRDSFDH